MPNALLLLWNEKYPAPKDEIQGFFDDGNILLVQNCETIYRLKDFYSDEKTVLLQIKNIYRTIMHTDELLVCTLDDYGLMEIYIYDFASKKSTKIANANSTPLDFNKNYVICGDEGIGMQELINRSTGEFDNIVSNDTKKDQDDENSLGNIKEGDYKNAISDNELNNLLKIITQYYQNKLSWEVVDYRIADNNHSFYRLYNDYELGNIIVFAIFFFLYGIISQFKVMGLTVTFYAQFSQKTVYTLHRRCYNEIVYNYYKI